MRLALVAIAATVALLLVPLAAGHAVYLDSSPAKGERVTVPPSEVWVLLTEPVDPGTFSFEVYGGDGQKVSTGQATLVASPQARVSVALQPNVPVGAYIARWQVLSTADGHITTGSMAFAVGDAVLPAQETGEDTQAGVLGPWARWASFMGMALAAGGILFAALGRRLPWTQVGLPGVVLVGAALNAGGIGLLFWDTVQQSGLDARAVAQTSVGAVLAIRMAASVLAAVVAVIAFRQSRITRGHIAWATGFLLVAAAASARLGHASLAGASAILVDLTHLVAVTLWIGGILVFLGLIFRAARRGVPADEVRALGRDFSPVALACVIGVAVTGTVTLWTITKDYIPDRELLNSAWGRYLASKVLLTVAMIVVAAANRYIVLAGSEDWPSWMWRRLGRFQRPVGNLGPRHNRLRRLVQMEAIWGVTTLFLAAMLTSISPPSTATASPIVQPDVFEEHGDAFMIRAAWTEVPSAGGSSALEFRLMTHDGNPIANNSCGRPSGCVLLEVTGSNGSGLQVYEAEPLGGGEWRSEPILWVTSGVYRASLKVQTNDVYLDEMDFNVVVA